MHGVKGGHFERGSGGDAPYTPNTTLSTPHPLDRGCDSAGAYPNSPIANPGMHGVKGGRLARGSGGEALQALEAGLLHGLRALKEVYIRPYSTFAQYMYDHIVYTRPYSICI